MYRDKSIAVVVPAYNEEKLIGRVLETMPDYVDYIIVVDDCSQDRTIDMVEKYQRQTDRPIDLIRHEVNQGVGGAITTGYKLAIERRTDITAVMAGDAQMDPDDLSGLLDPVVDDETDYSKGNRLFTGDAWKIIPKRRYIGNSILSLLTKIASGYWHVADSQTGYTAVSLNVLQTLNLDQVYKRYGMPNDFLVRLNVSGFRVRDVPIRPVYNIGEVSGIKIGKVVFTMSYLLLKLFFWRLKERYVIRDFHPLILFYAFSFLFFVLDVPLIGRIIWVFSQTGSIPPINFLTVVFITTMAYFFLLFAMWFDMDYNKSLK
ncbi:MAG: glycosyltransferase family 2 protein [Candidatus Latescibacteria bacterium]|nr:glycosyltransferase family 2 protein [Candidatus Latescibacterota bacterium]